MNAMIYMRGHRDDYDDWARNGATGWSYDEVLPLFKRSERNSRGADEYHGVDGPLHVEDLRSPSEASFAMVDALIESGNPRNPDHNGAEQLGVDFDEHLAFVIAALEERSGELALDGAEPAPSA